MKVILIFGMGSISVTKSNLRKNFLFWKIFLGLIFWLVFVHFAKDVTQDILGLKTFLDILGNTHEDLSGFPEWLVWIYHWAGVNSLLAEIALLVIIPKTWRRRHFSRSDLWIFGLILYLLIFFIIATFLDPRF